MEFQTVLPFLKETTHALMAANSPSGFTSRAVDAAEGIARSLGYPPAAATKGNLTILVEGEDSGRTVGLCAHVDTLGLMVRSIGAGGELMFTRIGGPILPTLDGEYCTVCTRDGRSYSGTVLSLSPAAHVFDDVLSRPRMSRTCTSAWTRGEISGGRPRAGHRGGRLHLLRSQDRVH